MKTGPGLALALALALRCLLGCGSAPPPVESPGYMHNYEDSREPAAREPGSHGDGESSSSRAAPNDHNKGGTKTK